MRVVRARAPDLAPTRRDLRRRRRRPRAAASSAGARDVRVCAFLASSPEDRAWADTHLAAHAFPTVIAMPKRGGVYKYAGADRDLPKLRAFADAAFRAGAPSRAVTKPSAEHLASSALNALAPNIQVADTVERALVGVIGAKPASVAADAVATATPFAFFGFGVALLLSTFRRALAGAFARPPGGGTRARGVADAASAYYESGAGGPGGSAQAAAARLDAAGFGYPAGADEGPARRARLSRPRRRLGRSRRARRSARRWRTSAVGPWSSPTRARGAGTKPPSPKARRWRNWASGLSW